MLSIPNTYEKRRDQMKYLSIFKTVERNTPPSQEEMATMGKLIEEGMKAGWLLATEGCLPSALGARVRMNNGKISVTDGPFAEAKEVVGGFAILQAKSKEEAVNGSLPSPACASLHKDVVMGTACLPSRIKLSSPSGAWNPRKSSPPSPASCAT
jgi:hypothetical protein